MFLQRQYQPQVSVVSVAAPAPGGGGWGGVGFRLQQTSNMEGISAAPQSVAIF